MTCGTWRKYFDHVFYAALYIAKNDRYCLHGVYCVLCFHCSIRPKGLRDDLVLLLEGDLSHINLCSLHCEMCNTEQLLSGFLGLFAYRVGYLDLLNAALSSYGAESQQDFFAHQSEGKTWSTNWN